ncbi:MULTISPECIES: hypothetical protein [Cupriavidus]|uniref:Transmembrane protein n=1 Tax=Cupriavidus pinatubonensis TaxID=248026 RepID=A0ABN7ZUJ0_9BURK|nr:MULTISPECIES: hypothetical protein [Cupriavidus]QYY28574.1 hypothetical protein K2O51_11980 [Cupriavidus pinatubonensis]CAG9187332.1 hypothetical protein LMG23994_06777 [Cupriavidus pinatubonensis]
MTPRRGPMLGAWLSALGLAALCTVALVEWLEPAHALAWVQLMSLCR